MKSSDILRTLKESSGSKTLHEFSRWIERKTDRYVPEPTLNRWLNEKSNPSGLYKDLLKELLDKCL